MTVKWKFSQQYVLIFSRNSQKCIIQVQAKASWRWTKFARGSSGWKIYEGSLAERWIMQPAPRLCRIGSSRVDLPNEQWPELCKQCSSSSSSSSPHSVPCQSSTVASSRVNKSEKAKVTLLIFQTAPEAAKASSSSRYTISCSLKRWLIFSTFSPHLFLSLFLVLAAFSSFSSFIERRAVYTGVCISIRLYNIVSVLRDTQRHTGWSTIN